MIHSAPRTYSKPIIRTRSHIIDKKTDNIVRDKENYVGISLLAHSKNIHIRKH
jgi:hypothetical protein